MDSRHGKKRTIVEGDRLSNLPDDLIHKILSFIGIRHAIRTSALSSRWRYIWTSMPYLNFSSKHFYTTYAFSEFVTRVLSGRNNQIEVSSVKLTFHSEVSEAIFKRVLNYAFSHNAQQLGITTLHADKIEFPISLFSSQSHKNLTLHRYTYEHSIPTLHTWELPALATVNLCYVTLYEGKCDGLFSNCANLKNLNLRTCRLMGPNGFNISHPGLSCLKIENGFGGVNVVTPQLKNLTIKDCKRIHLISTPNLFSLHYSNCSHDYDYESDYDYYDTFNFCEDGDREGNRDGDYDNGDSDAYPLQLSTELSHLETVDICIYRPYEDEAYTHEILCLLQQLHNVQFLTLNWELVKLLSSCVEVISHQPSPFVNLKSLKIYPHYVTPEERAQPILTISSEVTDYLLDGSPDATITMVSHEEIRAVMNVTSVRNLMRELQELVDQWKKNSERNTARMKQGKGPMESHMTTVREQVEIENLRAQPDIKMRRHFQERMAHINNYWVDMNNQFQNGKNITSRTISTLQKIEGLLTKVPASHQTKLEARFSCLCAEADTMMDSMMDRMKIECDKKPIRPNVFLHELATSSHSSS